MKICVQYNNIWKILKKREEERRTSIMEEAEASALVILTDNITLQQKLDTLQMRKKALLLKYSYYYQC